MNNKEKIRDVIIGILITIIILLVSFIILIKLDIISFNSKKEVKGNNSIKEDIKEEEKITLDDVNFLIDKYTKNFIFANIFKDIQLSNEMKVKISYTNLSENDFITLDCLDYSEKLEYDSNYSAIKNNKEMRYKDSENLYCYENSFSYLTINNIYHELFGNSVNFPKDDFKVGLSKYKYSSINDRFEEYVVISGIEYMNINVYSVIDYEIKDNNLIVNVGYVEYNNVNDENIYVSDISGMPKYTEGEMDKSNYSKIINDNIDLVEKYELTFFKEDGMYKLNRIEKR